MSVDDTAFTDDDWRTLLRLLIKQTGDYRFQQWESFSLPLPGTPNPLYVHWGMQPPHGPEYAHLYPLVDPETGHVVPGDQREEDNGG